MDDHRRSWIEKKTAAARGRISELTKVTRKGSVSRGERCVFRFSPNNAVSWVAVFHVKDDPLLWYFVAADSFAFVGSADVPVAKDGDPTAIVLRCNYGMWIHMDDLPSCMIVERLDSDVVSYAHEKLELLTKGELVSTPNAYETDEEDDYLDWCKSIEKTLNFFENLIKAPPSEYVLRHNQEPVELSESANEEFALAAAGPETDSSDRNDSEVLRIRHEMDAGGTLEVTTAIISDELDLAYRPKSDEQPESLILVNGDLFQSSWGDKVGNLYLLDKPIPTVDGVSTLTFGSGKQVRLKFPNAT